MYDLNLYKLHFGFLFHTNRHTHTNHLSLAFIIIKCVCVSEDFKLACPISGPLDSNGSLMGQALFPKRRLAFERADEPVFVSVCRLKV